MLFLGVWFFLLAAQESCYQGAQHFRGVVVEKGHKAGTSGTGRGSTGSSSYYWVRYRFTTAEGETKEHVDKEVLPGTWRELEDGGPVDIEYLSSLADSRVAAQKASSWTYLWIAIVLVAAGIATRRSARRQVSNSAPAPPS